MGVLILILVLLVFLLILSAWLASRNRNQPTPYQLSSRPKPASHQPAHDPSPPAQATVRYTQQIPEYRAFHLFIERFKGQRKKQQFAVLFLSSEKNLAKMEFRTRYGMVSVLNPATNNDFATYPPDNNLCNFVTARPEGQHHAEALLMRKFNRLMSSCREQRMPPCQCIVLYTWLLPCEYCTRQILQTLASQTQHYKVILVYTTKMHDVSDENERDTVSTLKSNGISVRHKRYRNYLPSLE